MTKIEKQILTNQCDIASAMIYLLKNVSLRHPVDSNREIYRLAKVTVDTEELIVASALDSTS